MDTDVVQLGPFRKQRAKEEARVATVLSTQVLEDLPTVEDIDKELRRRGAQEQIQYEQNVHKAIPADSFEDLPALSRIASRLEPSFRRIFVNAVKTTQRAIDLERLAQAIESGKPQTRLYALAELETYERRIAAYDGPIRQAFLRGSAFANTSLQDLGLTINFQLMNTHAATFAERNVLRLAQDFAEEAKDRIREIVSDAVSFGDTPQEAAKAIKRQVGFTRRDRQEYTKAETDFRDRGFSGDALDKRLNRVANGLITRRAKTIARTEVIRAANGGQLSLWEEAAAEGLISKQVTRKVWLTADDELLCPICRPLDGVEKKLSEEFLPGVLAPPQHPNCRCAMHLVFKESPV